MADLHKLIKAADFDFPDQLGLSEELKALIKSMIVRDPSKRLTLPQILSHPWLKDLNSSSDEESEDEKEEEAKKGSENPEEKAIEGTKEKAEKGEDGEKEKEEEKKEKEDSDDDIDFNKISGNINYVNVDNLFYGENYKTKLSYSNYCSITEDVTTKVLSEDIIKEVCACGFPRDFVMNSL